MDQHPVPQNVTTFQFRLIGDMTIKQFGFLAGGAILAFISYKLPLPFFFSWPLTMVFALGGVGFAFVPIEERPMDVWVLSFLKNVYSPTVFTWEQSAPQKTAATPTQPRTVPVSQQYRTSMNTMPVQQRPVTQAPVIHQQIPVQAPPVAAKTTASVVNTMYAPKSQAQSFSYPSPQITQNPQTSAGMFDWIFDLFKPKAPSIPFKPVLPTQAPHMATPSVVGSHLDISMPPTVSKQQVNQKPIVEPTPTVSVLADKKDADNLRNETASDTKILDLQKQLADALAQKEKVAQQVKTMQHQASTVPEPRVERQQASHTPPASPLAQNVAGIAQTQKQPTVKIITPEGAVKAGLPRLTTFPNVVTGITKDSDNNFLPGVLVTVKDKEGIPVRALKTNRLGQFAASTPLSNGVYFVEIEDPRQRYTFDRVQITLNGSIVPALEIITKSQKQITRDKLTKELFGTTN